MTKLVSFCYGLVAYLVFLGAFLYAIGFVADMVVPKDIDHGEAAPVLEAVIVNILLLSVFAVQHSGMARQPFKRWWMQFIPASVERSTYVLLASLTLILVFWQWRPIPTMIWDVEEPVAAATLLGLSLFGWVLVLVSTFLINHFELFGLKQVLDHLTAQSPAAPQFKTPLLYKFIRHPIYLGFIIAFWSTPVMTAGHLLFAAVTTAYILVGILLEEHDLTALYGEEYRKYRSQVGMLIPVRRRVD
jgi:protein-S-isoprenylcysteine O-methyltransferase Ste14